MCATRHSANAVTTSGPDKQASWLFDLQDHQLIQLVNSFVAARNMSMSLAQPEEGLHPRGIIKLTTDPGMRIARAVIILLESLEARGPQERLQALRRLHDEVLYSALSSLQKNTARVLIQIMKDLVRAAPHVHIQLPLAHDFYQAVRGTPHVIRSLLRRYHLLEMPEYQNYLDTLGQRWEVTQLYFKPYTCCRWGHQPIQACIDLMKEYGFTYKDVEHVTVNTFTAAARLSKIVPHTTDEAQYNIAFPVASALVHGDVGFLQMREEALDDQRVLDTMKRLEFKVDPEMEVVFPTKRMAWSLRFA